MRGVRVSTIRALLRSLGLALGLFTFIGGISLWGLQSQARSVHALTRGDLAALSKALAASESAAELEIALLRVAESLDLDLASAFRILDELEARLREIGAPSASRAAADVAELREELQSLGSAQELPLARVRQIHIRIDQLAAEGRRQVRERGRELLERTRQIRNWVGAGVLGGWIVLAAAAVYTVRGLRRPIQEVLEFLEAAARGDLTRPLRISHDREMGALARAASRLGMALVEGLRSLARAAETADVQSRRLGVEALRARQGVEQTIARVREGVAGARTAEETARSLQEAADRLREQSDQTAAGVQEILAMTQQVRAEMEGLSRRVGAAAQAMDELNRTSIEVASVADQLGSAARTIEASVSSIEAVAGALRGGAREGKELAAGVVERSREGLSSMEAALGAMARIREAVDAAVARFERLDGELKRVGRILEVIDEVAARTNLLSLNAAIIAAQAGEKGRSFGIVAAEIRSLAEQTALGTREIRSIVDGLLAGGRDTAAAISDGENRVTEGEVLVRETAELLRGIHESAAHAAARLGEIEEAGRAQAREADRVAGEILQVGQAVGRIVSAVHDQERRTQEVLRGLQVMEAMARQTVDAVDAQTRGTERITRGTMEVTEVSRSLEEAAAQLRSALEELREDLEALGAQAQEDLAHVERLQGDSDALADTAAQLLRHVERYRLPAGSR